MQNNVLDKTCQTQDWQDGSSKENPNSQKEVDSKVTNEKTIDSYKELSVRDLKLELKKIISQKARTRRKEAEKAFFKVSFLHHVNVVWFCNI